MPIKKYFPNIELITMCMTKSYNVGVISTVLNAVKDIRIIPKTVKLNE